MFCTTVEKRGSSDWASGCVWSGDFFFLSLLCLLSFSGAGD